jgi:hypothetical protein
MLVVVRCLPAAGADVRACFFVKKAAPAWLQIKQLNRSNSIAGLPLAQD